MKIHKRSAVLGGTLGAVAVAGALIAGPVFADDSATSSAGSAISNGMHAPDFDGDGPMSDSATVGMRGGPRGHGGGMFGGAMLHSEGVVARTTTSGTTYITVRTQTGKVTAASDTSVTVRSDDGYTRTWSIGSGTAVVKAGATVKASAFAVGDVVSAAGTVDGDAVTTNFVGSGGDRGGFGGRGRHGGRDGDGPMGGNGAPAGTLAPMPGASSTNA